MESKIISRSGVILATVVLLGSGAARADWIYSGTSGQTARASDNSSAGQHKVRGYDAGYLSASGYDSRVLFTFTNTAAIQSSITDAYFQDGIILGIDGTPLVSSGVSYSKNAMPVDPPGGDSQNPKFLTTQGFSADSNAPQLMENGVNHIGEYVRANALDFARFFKVQARRRHKFGGGRTPKPLKTPEIRGVRPEEYVGLYFTLQPSLTYSDTIAALQLGAGSLNLDESHKVISGEELVGLLIGIHAQGFADGKSINLININPGTNESNSGPVTIPAPDAVPEPSAAALATIDFTLSQGSRVNYSSSTTLSAVPAPGGLVLALSGLPFLSIGTWRRRRVVRA